MTWQLFGMAVIGFAAGVIVTSALFFLLRAKKVLP